MLKHKKLIAIVACLAIFLALFLSVFLISAESDHDCYGEECPICHEMQFCAQVLKTLTTVLIITAFCVASCCFFLHQSVKASSCDVLNTLVSLKVKLSY